MENMVSESGSFLKVRHPHKKESSQPFTSSKAKMRCYRMQGAGSSECWTSKLYCFYQRILDLRHEQTSC